MNKKIRYAMQTSRAGVKARDRDDIDRTLERFNRMVKDRNILYQYQKNQEYTPNTDQRRKQEYKAKMRERDRQKLK